MKLTLNLGGVLLSTFIIYMIYQQAGWATAIFAFLTYIEMWLLLMTINLHTKILKDITGYKK